MDEGAPWVPPGMRTARACPRVPACARVCPRMPASAAAGVCAVAVAVAVLGILAPALLR